MASRTTSRGAAPVTLGELAAEGRRVWLWCERCARSRSIAATVLARRLPADLPVPLIGRRVRCRICGGREVHSRPHWPPGEAVASHRWHDGGSGAEE